MYRRLTDLRFLRVAALLEKTLEDYEEFLRGLVPHAPIRDRLAPLFAEGPGHAELKRILAQFEDTAARGSGQIDPADALQAILDCETFAHEFYLGTLDGLSDPRVVKLFRSLADEERHHMAHANAAIEMLGKTPSSRKST